MDGGIHVLSSAPRRKLPKKERLKCVRLACIPLMAGGRCLYKTQNTSLKHLFRKCFICTWPAAPSVTVDAGVSAAAEAGGPPAAPTARTIGTRPPASGTTAAGSRKGDGGAASAAPGGRRAWHCRKSLVGKRNAVASVVTRPNWHRRMPDSRPTHAEERYADASPRHASTVRVSSLQW